MIRAFRGLRYVPARAGDPADLVTQPYDKISPELKAHYEALSPYNVVRLIRGESAPDDRDWYGEAATRLQQWIVDGVLALDGEPAFYVQAQTFTMPDGTRRTRRGVTGIFDLAHRDRVLHHEKTHGKARADRRRLLDATGVHFGQIFILRHDGPALDPSVFDAAVEPVTVTEPDGCIHRFSSLTDPAAVDALEGIFRESRFVIADGHHRFTVAGQYADESEHEGAGAVMVTCVDLADEGLEVLPTHRSLRGLPATRTNGLLPFFQAVRAQPFPLLDDVTPFLDAVREAGAGTIGVVSRAGAFLWPLDKRGREGVEALDTYRLDTDVVRPLLADLTVEEHLGYHRDAAALALRARAGEVDVAFILNAIEAREVADIAEGGGVMPPKSTDFYPKMLTGFVMYDTIGERE